MQRNATITRETNETQITITFSPDQTAVTKISTGIPFFDHMLNGMTKHGPLGMELMAKGDLEIDCHHTMEDIGLVLGNAIKQSLGDKKGIRRFAHAIIPMDDALARVVIDISGRPYLAWRVQTPQSEVANIPIRLFREFFQAVVNTAGITLHIDLLAGEEEHHCMEAIFKAFGKALKAAAEIDSANPDNIPSTKGSLD